MKICFKSIRKFLWGFLNLNFKESVYKYKEIPSVFFIKEILTWKWSHQSTKEIRFNLEPSIESSKYKKKSKRIHSHNRLQIKLMTFYCKKINFLGKLWLLLLHRHTFWYISGKTNRLGRLLFKPNWVVEESRWTDFFI